MSNIISSQQSADIALFTGTLEGGGGERLQISLAKYFVAKGLKVDFVVCKNRGSLKGCIPEGVRFVSLDAPRILLSLPAYLRYLKEYRPKSVVSSVARATIISCLGKLFSKEKHRLVVRVDNVPYPNIPLHKQVSRHFIALLMNLTYPFADHIISISLKMKEQLVSFPLLREDKIINVYNPAIPDDYEEKLKQAPELLDGLALKTPVVLAVGRFHPQKDYPNLLRAFAALLEKKDANLIILGEGELKGEAVALAESLNISEKVHFLGFVSNPIAYMKNADVYVMSSLYEGLPGVLIEALASGTPIVSTDCVSGPSEILAGGKFGELVPVSNHQALADAIFETLSKPKKPMSEELKEHLEQFKIENVGEQYLRLALPDKY